MTIMSPGNLRLLAWLPISIALAMTAWGGEPAPPGSILVVDGQTLRDRCFRRRDCRWGRTAAST
jgi:hypothetical protein